MPTRWARPVPPGLWVTYCPVSSLLLWAGSGDMAVVITQTGTAGVGPQTWWEGPELTAGPCGGPTVSRQHPPATLPSAAASPACCPPGPRVLLKQLETAGHGAGGHMQAHRRAWPEAGLGDLGTAPRLESGSLFKLG